MRPRRLAAAAAAALVVALAGPARAEAEAGAETDPAAAPEAAADPPAPAAEAERRPNPNRFELAPFPSLGGNTDIGFQFGVNIGVARLAEGYRPYRYRIGVVAELSVKSRPEQEGGAEIPIHNYELALDLPGLAGGRLRLLTTVGFDRSVNDAYWGLAGLSDDDPLGRIDLADVPFYPGRRYQYRTQRPAGSLNLRWRVGDEPVELLFGAGFSYVMPAPYLGSLIELDANRFFRPDGSRVIMGFDDHALVELRTGVLWDRRDDEIAPTRGTYVEVSARGGVGFPRTQEIFGFGGLIADVRLFVPIIGQQRLTLASRFLLDVLFGDVPFYELASFGAFSRSNFASSQGVAGAPGGRRAGNLKMLGSLELRSLFLPFRLFRMQMMFGLLAFFTVGQVWSTLDPGPPFDGSVEAATYGTGGALLLRWGESVMVRIELAYSPDSSDGGDPFGFYFDLGYAF